MRYIVHSNGKGAEVEIPRGLSAEQWGEIHEAFAAKYGPKGVNYASFTSYDAQQVINGVFYNWGLASRDGAYFEVFQWPENSDADVKFAVNKLRRDQDVVSLWVTKLKRVEFDISEIIAQKA